jgi:hypothetical protein
MTASQTPSRTERWTPIRIFRSTFAVTFGLLAVLILLVGLLWLLLGSGGRETLIEEDVVIEDATADEQSAHTVELALTDGPDDACILPMHRRPRFA